MKEIFFYFADLLSIAIAIASVENWQHIAAYVEYVPRNKKIDIDADPRTNSTK